MLRAVLKVAVLAVGIAALAWLAGPALDSECEAHSHTAFGAQFDPED